jgi:hypothetical protein
LATVVNVPLPAGSASASVASASAASSRLAVVEVRRVVLGVSSAGSGGGGGGASVVGGSVVVSGGGSVVGGSVVDGSGGAWGDAEDGTPSMTVTATAMDVPATIAGATRRGASRPAICRLPSTIHSTSSAPSRGRWYPPRLHRL